MRTLFCALLLTASAAFGQTPTRGGLDGELDSDVKGNLYIFWDREWSLLEGGNCSTVGVDLARAANCPQKPDPCDELQPPETDGDWAAYESRVKECRGELMAEYVMRAARSCGYEMAITITDCPPMTQENIDRRAETYLKQDKALLRRLLRLLAQEIKP